MKQLNIDQISDFGLIFIKTNDVLSRIISYKFGFLYNKVGFYSKINDNYFVHTMDLVTENTNLIETQNIDYWVNNFEVENIYIRKLNTIIVDHIYRSELTNHIQLIFQELVKLLLVLSKKRKLDAVLDNWLYILCIEDVLDLKTYIEENGDNTTDNNIDKKDDNIEKNKQRLLSNLKKQSLTSFQIVNLLIFNIDLEVKRMARKKYKLSNSKMKFPKVYFTYNFARNIIDSKNFSKFKRVIINPIKTDNLTSKANISIIIKFLELYSNDDFRNKFELQQNKKISYSEVLEYVLKLNVKVKSQLKNTINSLEVGTVNGDDLLKNKTELDEQFSSLFSSLNYEDRNKDDIDISEIDYFCLPHDKKIKKRLTLCHRMISECVTNIKNEEEPSLNLNLISSCFNLLTRNMLCDKIPILTGEYSYKGAFVIGSNKDNNVRVQLKSKKRVFLTPSGKNDLLQFNKNELKEILLHLDNIADNTIRIDTLRVQVLDALHELQKEIKN